MTKEITIDDFRKVDARVGKIIEAEDFPEAIKPAYKLKIDFGEYIGVKTSSAQLIDNYSKEELVGRRVIGVVNFPPRKIGPFWSEVLTLGVPNEKGQIILVKPDQETPLGGRLF
ncbi:MAG: tRNA-binding protein [Candidatus Micrarchaeia archaeon]